MNKTRILTWVVVALALFNVATILTVVCHFNKGKKFFHREHSEMGSPPAKNLGLMIKDKLQLTEIQIVKFDSIENIFKKQSEGIFGKMKVIRDEMIEEITSENPDSSTLIQLTKDLGDQHIGLKMNTFNFYFSMKKVCKPEQQKELSNIFRGMFMYDGMSGPGRDKGRQDKYNRDNRDKRPENRCDSNKVGKVPGPGLGKKCAEKQKPGVPL